MIEKRAILGMKGFEVNHMRRTASSGSLEGLLNYEIGKIIMRKKMS